jgi:type I restriction enzyme S subunit
VDVSSEYKETEVGTIPADWKCATVSEVAAPIRNAVVGGPFGSDLGSKDYRSVGVPVVRGQNLRTRVLSDDFVYVSHAKAASLEANLARPGDLLFTQRGTVGQVSVAPDQPYDRYVVSQSQMKLTVNRKAADPHFLYYVFSSARHQQRVREDTIQTSLPHINLGILRRWPVPLPPLVEQRAIASALSDAHTLIESLEHLLAKKRQIKQGAMQELLSGRNRLPGFAGNCEFKQTAAGVLPAEWNAGPIGRAIETLEAGASVNSEKVEAPEFESYPCVLKTGAANGGLFNPRESKKVAGRDLWRLNVSVRKDTILISRMNTLELVGESGYVLSDYPNLFVPDRMWMATVRSTVSPRWLSHILTWRPVKSQISASATGTSGSMKNISKPSFRAVEIPYPPLEEQCAIAKVLSGFETEITNLAAKLVKARQLKQGMMQELLTGRIRLV